jgi:hypothetical protein
MLLLLAINPAAILIWLLIIVIFIAAAWYVIGLLPGEFQRWAKAILLVVVAILLIYWLANMFPSPFGMAR